MSNVGYKTKYWQKMIIETFLPFVMLAQTLNHAQSINQCAKNTTAVGALFNMSTAVKAFF